MQLDPDNTGFIAVENFTSLVEHHELQLDPSKLDMLLALVQSNEEGQVCYQELIELVSGKKPDTHVHTDTDRAIQRESHETFYKFHTYIHPLLSDFRKVTELIQTEPGKLRSGEN